MPTQLDRIEEMQKKILDGLKQKEQLDRIESGMAAIADEVGSRKEIEELSGRLDKQAAEFDAANKPVT